MTLTLLTLDGTVHKQGFDCADGMDFHVVEREGSKDTLRIEKVLCEVVDPVRREDHAFVVRLADGRAAYIEVGPNSDSVWIGDSVSDLASRMWNETLHILEFLALRELGTLSFEPPPDNGLSPD